MNSPLRTVIAPLILGLVLAVGGCTYYQVSPGVYSSTSVSTFDRSWSAALGALEDEGVLVVNADRAGGSIRGTRAGIHVTALVQARADGSVKVEFKTGGDTVSDPALIDRITRSYHYRMGR